MPLASNFATYLLVYYRQLLFSEYAVRLFTLTLSIAAFNSTLAANVDSQDLLSRIWQLLAK